ncbi:MAG: diguanylate cyclase [Myxococcota bacterium]
MSRPATGKPRRRSGNERYRQGFLSQAATELREFALLLTEEPDAQESVAFELHRLAETADALELPTISRAAIDAAEELEQSGVGLRALRRVANAIRHTGGRLRFGPVCLVGITGDQARELEEDAALCCEPVYLFDDLAAFAGGLHTEQPTAVVLPAEATEAVAQLVQRENFPVLVHGPSGAWEQHAAAMSAGAHGYLPHPFRLADVTRLARWRNQPREEALFDGSAGGAFGGDVVVVGDPDAARDELVAALVQASVHVVTASDPSELSALLESGPPHAVVLSAWVAGYPALPLAMLIRSHPRSNHVPILVIGRPDDAQALRAIGVDDVMRNEAQGPAVAQRVRDRVLRMSTLPWDHDPVSGLATRLGVLGRLDGELAVASRTGHVLSVALIELDGLRTAVEAFGAGAVAAARKRVVRLFREGLRRTDVYGELSLGELVVALPSCGRSVAARRIEELAERFHAEVAREPHLANVQMLVGVADTADGLRTVAVRAERELRSVGAGKSSGRQ